MGGIALELAHMNCFLRTVGRQSTKKGFSLVELLVVIAIISLLMAVVLASMSSARKKARDDQRLSDLKQLQAAIEIYGSANGRYPVACGNSTEWRGHGSSYGSCATNYITGISELMSPLPIDSVTTQYGYIYRTNTNGTAYKLMTYNALEFRTVNASSEYARYRTSDSCSATMTTEDAKTYAVYNGNEAKCW